MSAIISLDVYTDKIDNTAPKGNNLELTNTALSFDSDYTTAATKFKKQLRPTVFFVCEFVVDKKLKGALLCFEKYFNATHYEIYKRNIFGKSSKFEKILVLDSANLEDETKIHIPYVKNFLQFTPSNCYIICDLFVKEDRIYEYKVVAGYYPTSSDIDFAILSEQMDNLNTILYSGNYSINQFLSHTHVETKFQDPYRKAANSNYTYSRRIKDEWLYSLFCLLNNEVSFFSTDPKKKIKDIQSLVDEDGQTKSIKWVKNLSQLETLIKECFSKFGGKESVKLILKKCSKIQSLESTDASSVISSIIDISLNNITETDDGKVLINYTNLVGSLGLGGKYSSNDFTSRSYFYKELPPPGATSEVAFKILEKPTYDQLFLGKPSEIPDLQHGTSNLATIEGLLAYLFFVRECYIEITSSPQKSSIEEPEI